MPDRRRRPQPVSRLCALLAAGLDGIEDKMELEPAFRGDAYAAKQLARSQDAARGTEALDKSEMLRAAFGDR